MSAGRGNHW